MTAVQQEKLQEQQTGALSAKTTEVSQTARLQLHCCSLRVVQPPAAIKDFGVTVQVCTYYASIMVTLQCPEKWERENEVSGEWGLALLYCTTGISQLIEQD